MNLTIGGLVTILIAGLLIRFATKFLLKLFGWLLLIGLGVYVMYHYGIGPFKQKPSLNSNLGREVLWTVKRQGHLRLYCHAN